MKKANHNQREDY